MIAVVSFEHVVRTIVTAIIVLAIVYWLLFHD